MVPWYKSLKFWESLSVLVAVVATQLGYVNLEDSAKILAAVLAFLNLIGVTPQARERGLLQ